MTRLEVFVHGIPQPQGGLKSIPYSKGNGRMGVRTFNKSEKLDSWRERVERGIREAMQEQDISFDTDRPVEVYMSFYFLPPQSKIKKRTGYPLYPTTKPDIDKLTRGILDSFTFATGVDDSRVSHINADKMYSDDPNIQGVSIQITQFDQEYSKDV